MKVHAALVVVMAFAVAYLSGFTGFFTWPANQYASVIRIIDGDTIEIEGGPKVRLLGIDAPEKGQYMSEEAGDRLEGLIGGRQVRLEPDATDKDKYGRLLRYVFMDAEEPVNLLLVREGLAEVLIIPPDSMYENELLEAESEARSRNLGIWKYSEVQYAFCIGIYYFRFNAAGDDRKNLNDEYVEFRNRCEHPVDITGWMVSDSSGNRYMFKGFVAGNKTIFRLHSGAGLDNSTDLYWSSKIPVWNNNGDTLTAANSKGQLMLNYSYSGY